MDPSHKKKLRLLFAASVAAGGLAGMSAEARAFCSCLPGFNTRPIAAASFQFLGSGTYGYDVGLLSDSLYGFRSSTPATVYADFYSNMTQTLTAKVCRVPFSGAAAVCGPDTVINTPSTGTYYDSNISTSGVSNASNSMWDYYKLNIKSNKTDGRITPLGAGINAPACW